MGKHHLSNRAPVVFGVNGDVGPFGEGLLGF
jgi:hypothetical protein